MVKVQNDYYFRWAQDRIQATFTADKELDSLIEFAGVDTTSNTVEIKLPNSSGSDVLNTKTVYIIDQGNAATNNITIIPSSLDTAEIDVGTIVVDVNNLVIKFTFIDNIWYFKRLTGLSAIDFTDRITIDNSGNVVVDNDGNIILSGSDADVLTNPLG